LYFTLPVFPEASRLFHRPKLHPVFPSVVDLPIFSRSLRVFNGEHESSVDDKGRVILPSKLRDTIDEDRDGQGFYSTIGPDGCIVLCTPTEWDRRVKMLREAPFAPERARRFQRIMSAMTERSFADKQGRLRLSQNLLKQAGIEKQVAVVGNIDVIEIWNHEKWAAIKAESLQEFKNDAEQLF